MNFNSIESPTDNDAYQTSHIDHARAILQESGVQTSTSKVNGDITNKNASGSTTASSSSQPGNINHSYEVVEPPLQTSTDSEENVSVIPSKGIIAKEERKAGTVQAQKDHNYDARDESDEESEVFKHNFSLEEMRVLDLSNDLLLMACNNKDNELFYLEQGSMSNEDFSQLCFLQYQVKEYQGDLFQYLCYEVRMRFLWILVLQITLTMLKPQNKPIRTYLKVHFSTSFKMKLKEAKETLISKLPGWLIRSKVLENIQEGWEASFQQEVLGLQERAQTTEPSNSPSISQKTTSSTSEKKPQSQLKNKDRQVMEKARGIIDKFLSLSAQKIYDIWAEFNKSNQQWIEELTGHDTEEALSNKECCVFIGLHKFIALIKKMQKDVLLEFNNKYKQQISKNFFSKYCSKENLFIFGVILQVSLAILPQGEVPTEIIQETIPQVKKSLFFSRWMQEGNLDEKNIAIFENPKKVSKLRKKFQDWLTIVQDRLTSDSSKANLYEIGNVLRFPETVTRPMFHRTTKKIPASLQDLRDDDTGKRVGHELEMTQENTKKAYREQGQ